MIVSMPVQDQTIANIQHCKSMNCILRDGDWAEFRVLKRHLTRMPSEKANILDCQIDSGAPVLAISGNIWNDNLDL